MKKIFFLIISILFYTFALSNDSQLTEKEKKWLESHPLITLGSDSSWAPYILVDDKGNISGYDKDILDLINQNLGTNFQLKVGSWENMLKYAKEQSIDGLSTSAVHKKREKYFNFSHSYTTSKRLLVVSKNNPKDITSVDDLKGKRIGYQSKNLFDKKLISQFPGVILVPLESLEEVIDKLITGDIDATMGSYSLLYLAQKKGLPYLKILQTIPNSTLNLVFSIRKDYPEALSILNKGLNSIDESTLIYLRNKWFFETLQLKEDENVINLTMSEKEYLKKKNIIKMCVLPDWLPFEQIDENGNHKGIGADLMKIISQDINTPITLVKTDFWAESLQNIKDRKCDILPVAMDIPSRRTTMDFTKPYTKEPFVIATKSDKLFVRDAQSLNNKKIGIVKSYAFIEVLKQRNPLIEIIDVKNTKEGLEKVRSGELFGYIDTMPTIGYGIQKYSMLDLKIAGKLEFTIDLSIASRNDEPILNRIMQKALDRISEEEKRTIIGKWISITVEQGVDYSLLKKVLIVAVVIFILSILWNRNLRKINIEIEKSKKEVEKEKEIAEKALSDLKNTQVQLIQSEKLAALGQLIAGIAHEINTPIGAIKSSGENINESLSNSLINLPKIYKLLSEEEIKLFVELITSTHKEGVILNLKEERQIVRNISKELENMGISNARNIASKIMQINVYKEWKNFLPLLQHSEMKFIINTAYSIAIIKNGTRNINLSVDKVSKIIYALKSFSRFDQNETKVNASIQEGIETVLTIYHNQIKYGIELFTQYDNVPLIKCLPDELNQVWTNIIHNALQSMQNKGKLFIKIEKIKNDCVISFKDTGCGIPDDIKNKVFEPFFTTKEVGEGSGLGLDISSKIIAKHNGKIEFNSIVGQGTEFKIILPYS